MMLSEKSFYILLVIVILTLVYFYQNNSEHFKVTPRNTPTISTRKLEPCEIELENLKKDNQKLETEYNKMKMEADKCDETINGSIKNLESTQDRALIAANRQFEISKNASINSSTAQQNLKDALETQNKTYELMMQDSDKSAKELENALNEVNNTNKAFDAEYKKYVGSINLGRLSNLFKNAESFTDLPKPPTLEYFQTQEGTWRNDWRNKLKNVAIPNSLDPKDHPNNINIPLVINTELEDNLDKTTAQYIAMRANYISNNKMIPEAKRLLSGTHN